MEIITKGKARSVAGMTIMRFVHGLPVYVIPGVTGNLLI
jgi:hypothetical protein